MELDIHFSSDDRVIVKMKVITDEVDFKLNWNSKQHLRTWYSLYLQGFFNSVKEIVTFLLNTGVTILQSCVKHKLFVGMYK